MNKRGSGTIGVIFIAFIMIIVAAYTAPVVEDAILDTRDNTAYNCANDPDYNSSLETNKMGCGISFLISPLYLLGAAIAGILMILYSYKSGPEQYTQGY